MSDGPNHSAAPLSTGRFLGAIAVAWMLSLGFDLFLHAGLLAPLYMGPSPFLLPAQEAFFRIPFGYAAFLVLTAALAWLLRELGTRDGKRGFRLGAAGGLVVWGSLCLGLYSISTADCGLLLGWWLGQSMELGLAGAVMGSALGGRSIKWLAMVTGAVVVALAVATVLLQSLGFAPAVKFD